ncbi:AzlD domain-containing protein [Streptomyces sp. PT12]|uniref:AzlD domain-containing protein n=1 Tax=Streptomyces sp. PT12 TaxID=1510197 RepID=UPI000DE3E82B|nr:AzlD domain-containing protein [Streptomyces sp. PT12]RBM16098.1 branched-chain amino acid transporter [Streptomyces sp. PT12]
MPLYAILLLAAGTFAFRLAGPALGDRLRIGERTHWRLGVAAAVLLVALVATASLANGSAAEGAAFAGWARPAGVLAGGALALRRAPFPLVVIAAAVTTAALRLCGVP